MIHVFKGTLQAHDDHGRGGNIYAGGNARQRRRVIRHWKARGYGIRVWVAGFPNSAGRWVRREYIAP